MSLRTFHEYQHSALSDLEYTEIARRNPRQAFIESSKPIGTLRARYEGKPYTWLSESEEPRGIATSLHQTESNDLGIHLYNVQRVKRQARDDDEARRVKPYFRKDRRKPQEGPKSWTPRTSWTAWPLQPNMVPRVGEKEERWLLNPNHGEMEKGTSHSSQKPTANLEDCLLSEVLGQSRSSFYTHKEEHDVHRETTKLRIPGSGTFRPDIMTDEERARQLAKPVIRDIISQMELLLQALHASRSGHVRNRTSDSGTDASSGPESSNSRSRSRSGSARSRSSKPKTPLPRDWSEVLSIAGMMGWNSGVLQRTTARCSGLFGEPLDRVTTFDTTSADPPPSKLSVDAEDGEDDDDENDTSPEVSRELSLRTLCCPHGRCRSHSKPFKVRWRLNEHLRRTHKEETTSLSRSRSSSQSKVEAEPGQRARRGNYADDFLRPTILPSNSNNNTRRPKRKRKGQALQRPEPSEDAQRHARYSAQDVTTTDTSSAASSSKSSDAHESDSSESGNDQESLQSRSTGSSDVAPSESDQSIGK